MGMRERVRRMAVAVRKVDSRGCPGRGIVLALVEPGGPEPPTCCMCERWHILVIEVVVVAAGPERDLPA